MSMKTISFRAQIENPPTTTEGRVFVAGVLRAGTFNGFAVTHENARDVSLRFIDRVRSEGATGQGSHPSHFAERTIGQSVIVWRDGSWDEINGLSLSGEWLQTDAGRNARAEAEAGVPFGVSIYARTDDGGATLSDILYVDAVYTPAVPNRVISYAANQGDNRMDDDMDEQKVQELEQNDGEENSPDVANTSAEPAQSGGVAFSLDDMRKAIQDAVAAELQHQSARKPLPRKPTLPPAPQRGEPVAFGATMLGEGRKITPKRKAPSDKVAKINARYKQLNKGLLAKEAIMAENAVQFGLSWDTLPAPCTAVGVLNELVCEASYLTSIFPVETMEQYCITVEDMVLVDDGEFPTTDIVPAQALIISALGTWVTLPYPNAIAGTGTLVNVAFPAVALVEGTDYLTDGGRIFLIPNATTTGLNVAVNDDFTFAYSVSLLQNGVCQPTGRKVPKITAVQVEAKPYQIALKYCDMELFQIQAKYGADFASRVLRRVIDQLREFIDTHAFRDMWVAALTNGALVESWSQSTETVEQLIQKVGVAAIALVDSECVMRDDIVIITDPLTADILGRSNTCCRIDATNNGAVLGLVGTVTQHAYPLYSVETANLVYGGKVLVTTRDYLTQYVFQPLSIKEMVGGVEKTITAPSGSSYKGRAMETEWIAFTQIANHILRPTQARVINVVA